LAAYRECDRDDKLSLP